MSIHWFSLALLGLAGPDALEVGPAAVLLDSPRDRQRLVAVSTNAAGETSDQTGTIAVTIDRPEVVGWDPKARQLVPLAPGSAQVEVSIDGQSAKVPVTVKAFPKDEAPTSFRLDVMPVFMKLGCNGGRCHGSARGKDGFRLSLFGYDPAGDHERLTTELRGRRVNLALPEESLLLKKASGSVAHTGGKLAGPDEAAYQTIARWIAEGAKDDPSDQAVPTSVSVFPPRLVLRGPGKTQQLLVQARYSDGSDRDVTDLALYLTNNDGSVKVGPKGLATSDRRGEAFLMARFATFTVGVPAIVLAADAPESVAPMPVENYIDELVGAKLARTKAAPSEACTDAEFLRRASLDLVGLLPTRPEVEAFLADPSPTKRSALVDRLMAKEEFVDLWAMKWGELLKARTANQVSYKALLKYQEWFRERLLRNEPFDAIVRELVGSKGGTFESPATNLYQLEANPLILTEDVAQVFMGTRVQCAQCHNHPFDRWTMDDYYGLAAFFARVGYKQSTDPREYVIYDREEGETLHPVKKKPAPPRFLGGGEAPEAELGEGRREALADWMTSEKNPLFARHLANLVWAQYFGRGIVEPVDDARASNPPSNPELLDALAKRFVESKYDLRTLVRDVATSQTYQRSTRANATNADDLANFSKAQVRRLRAEVLLDGVSRATETRDKFDRLPIGARSVQIVDGQTSTYFLTTFGRATRATACSCEVNVQPNLSQALHLLNGDATSGKVREGNVVGKLLDAGRSRDEVMDELYLRCLGRRPTEAERTRLAPKIGLDARKGLEDLFWALLNSKEFLFNH